LAVAEVAAALAVAEVAAAAAVVAEEAAAHPGNALPDQEK
jgi:hypothetical protein